MAGEMDKLKGRAKEAAGAAESFQHEARPLAEVVGRFKTDRNDDRGRSSSRISDHVRVVHAGAGQRHNRSSHSNVTKPNHAP